MEKNIGKPLLLEQEGGCRTHKMPITIADNRQGKCRLPRDKAHNKQRLNWGYTGDFIPRSFFGAV
jgi:hypothetical protein